MHRVTLVHGFLGAPEDWDGVAAALGGTVHCDRVDLRSLGCGSVAAAAERRSAHLAHEAPGVLVGYSLGGRLCLAAAAATDSQPSERRSTRSQCTVPP
ncbi:MAG: alpha/beta fold hydrolase, partial [Phycisphaerales bacterium]